HGVHDREDIVDTRLMRDPVGRHDGLAGAAMIVNDGAICLTERRQRGDPVLEVPDPIAVCEDRLWAFAETQRKDLVARDIQEHASPLNGPKCIMACLAYLK